MKHPSCALCMAPVVLREEGISLSLEPAAELTPKLLLLKAHLCILRKSLIPTQQGCATALWDVTFGEEGEFQVTEPWQEPLPLARFCFQMPQDKTTASRTFPKHKSVGPHIPHPPRMTKISIPRCLQLLQAEASLCFY